MEVITEVIVYSSSSAPDGLNKSGKFRDEMLQCEAGAKAARWRLVFLPIMIASHEGNPTVIVFSASSAPDG